MKQLMNCLWFVVKISLKTFVMFGLLAGVVDILKLTPSNMSLPGFFLLVCVCQIWVEILSIQIPKLLNKEMKHEK